MTCTPPNASSPSLDLSGAYQRQLDHLIAMAKVEGFKAYAWKRAQALDEDQSGLWFDFKTKGESSVEFVRPTLLGHHAWQRVY